MSIHNCLEERKDTVVTTTTIQKQKRFSNVEKN
jgi:hypothetical protein